MSSEPEPSSGDGDGDGDGDDGPSTTAAAATAAPRYAPLSSSSPGPRGGGGAGGSPKMSWTQRLREHRHNPCLMKPATAILVGVIALLSLVGLALQLPTFLLGLVLSPLMRRGSWFVEFLYPMGLSRWVHIALMKWGLHSKMGTAAGARGNNRVPPQHSRTIEQRTEVVKGRVYVHPIPQLLDNVGYLIVCCPPPQTTGVLPLLGILVDCGDAASALAQVRLIRNTHYNGSSESGGYGLPPPGAAVARPDLQIHAVLCTHKHHDHTAGNKALLADPTVSKTLSAIYGGAVEDVPYGNRLVTNGQRIELPRVGENDMSAVAEIECIAVPSHTRGSVVYALRNKVSADQQQTQQQQQAEGQGQREPLHTEPDPNGNNNGNDPNDGIVSHLFTGDAMFSGGGGVAFEADVETPRDKNAAGKNRNSPVKVMAGRSSIERCFAEVLVRGGGGLEGGRSGDGGEGGAGAMAAGAMTMTTTADVGYAGRVMMYPGHEYTADLLLRQLDPSNEFSGQWTKLPPGVFFETAAQYFVSSHRRTLPKTGRLLTVPSPLVRELKTNPHFRSLRKRGEHLLSAVRVWHRYMSKGRVEDTHKVGGLVVQQSSSSVGMADSRRNGVGFIVRSASSSSSYKTPSTNTTWNMDHNDVNRSVFATVYASDLDAVIEDLQSGTIGTSAAARRLQNMRDKLDEPVVFRRPIPGTLPSERNMYLGVVALALLGSPPCGMTVGDSVAMNLPRPVDSSDEILVSKRRLLSVLSLLGLLQQQQRLDEDEEDYDMVSMIDLLWKEAQMDDEMDATSLQLAPDGERINEQPTSKPNYNATDVEATRPTESGDEIELGLLKLTLYGAALNQPSWFKKFCLPCGGGGGSGAADTADETASVTLKMRRSNGELVRHDILTCPMCRDVVGAPCAMSERTATCEDKSGGGDDDGGASVEDVYHHSVLMEGVGGSSSDEGERSDGVELRVVPPSL